MKKIITLSFALSILAFCFGQNGSLRGTVTDSNSGETLIGATVVKQGTTIGAATDFDGKYSFEIEPGTHTIIFSFISYATITVQGVQIKPGEVTVLDVPMASEAQTIQEVVITAREVRNSESAMLSMQRKSANVIDGISSQTFRKIGDNDAGAALKRVTGVAVQDGKHVFVRGLGDRYTKTIFNGMPIPGLDPDRNSVQVDLFPTNLIDNIVVYKTFSPNLPGDFSGGVVNIETKDFPDSKTFSVRYGTSYNPNMNLNDDFILYEGGKTDLLGFDDGTRELPINPLRDVPDPVQLDPQLESVTRRFDPEMATMNSSSFLNQNFNMSYGNQIEKDKMTIGFNGMINYALNYSYYDDLEFGLYIKPANSGTNQLEPSEVRLGSLGRRDALLSGLLTGAVKFEKSKYVLNLFATQNGISEASDRIARNFEQTSEELLEDVLTFSQRSMRNATLSGEHHFKNLDIEWKNAFTLSRVYDPDFRITGIAVGTVGDTTLNPGAGGRIDRFWRDLNEWSESFRVDFTIPMEFNGSKNSKLKFGLADTYKKREYEILQYNFKYRVTPDAPAISGNPNWFFQDDVIWTPEQGHGTFLVSSPIDSANIFTARQNVLAGYVMNELPISPVFNAIYGVRLEQINMYYTGEDQSGSRLEDVTTLDDLEILPSVNLVYKLNENSNLRGSFNRTLARPSFREKSNAQIFDPISKITFIGNLALNQTNINNFDLRWETFPSINEIVSLSVFYKQFNGHIEIVSFETAIDNVRPINSGNSQVYGAELEIRKDLSFISDTTQTFSVGGNISLVQSDLDTKSVQLPTDPGSEVEFQSEYDIRVQNARDGETIDENRTMAGQAPYLINAYLNFSNTKAKVDANVSYNVQGKTLSIVGIGRVPDVYQAPFHSLNMRIAKTLGKKERSRLSLNVQNILDSKLERFFESHNADNEIYSYFNEGRRFGLSYSYTIR